MPRPLPEHVQTDIERRRTRGEPFEPVRPNGSGPRSPVATTFWGRAWCHNLDTYADDAHGLPAGRSLLRNGHVYDIELSPGFAFAYVADDHLYEVETHIAPLPADRWDDLKARLTGHVENLVALLAGELDDHALETITAPGTGLFPAPAEITVNCNCPDHASLCAHGAAVLYAIAARFDTDPALFFTLRGVDHSELLASATTAAAGLAAPPPGSAETGTLTPAALADIFAIDLADPAAAFLEKRTD